MLVAARRRLAALRQTPAAVRLARALLLAWAVIVWNVVFDQVIVFAGRGYVHAAGLAAKGPGPYVRIDDWMRPAVTRALWIATAAAGGILGAGLVAVRAAARPGVHGDRPRVGARRGVSP